MSSYLLIFFSLVILNNPTVLAQKGGKLKLNIYGLRSDNGKVGIRLFNRPDGFPSGTDKAFKEFYVTPSGKQAVLEIGDLPPGVYAVACVHDENGNKKMDTNMIGIPKEGFGTSNNPATRFGPPDFTDAQFELNESVKTLVIKMKYF